MHCFLGVPQFVCSFRSSSTSGCGLIDYKKTWQKKILPLTCCQNSVYSHLQKFAINRRSIENKWALIKMRAGLFNEDDETLTVCLKHRYYTILCKRYMYDVCLVNIQASWAEYIVFSNTCLFYFDMLPYINIVMIFAFIKCHIQKCIPDYLCYLFLNCSWIIDTFLGLGGDQARCVP